MREPLPWYYYYNHRDLKTHNTIDTKYPVLNKNQLYRIHTHNKASRPYIAIRRTLQIELA
jgi:hypothetical protein